MNDEERELYHMEVEWRSKEIEDLKYQLFEHRKELANMRKPRSYTKILFITSIFLCFPFARLPFVVFLFSSALSSLLSK